MSQYNLITIISHDLGRYLGCYGVPNVRSPRIDELAQSALQVENAFCVAPQCSPSRAAMWTGRYPHANGMVGLCHGAHHNKLAPQEKHLAEILRDNGYQTWLHGPQHETREPEKVGFDYANEVRKADEVAEDFVSKLPQYAKDKPFFSEICFFEPHRDFPRSEDIPVKEIGEAWVPPYLPADLPVIQEDFADFEASVATLDRAVGRILDAVTEAGYADDTIIVFTADHGIPFPLAKMTLYDAGLEIPMIVRIPGGPRGEKSPALFSNIDFTPTMLDLLGLPLPNAERLHGTSQAEVFRGKDQKGRERVYGEKTFHSYYDPMRCVRTERWKFIANFEAAARQETSPDFQNNARGYPEVSIRLQLQGVHPAYELYDLQQDPFEQNNLAEREEHAETLRELKQDLLNWMRETEDPLLEGPVPSGTYLKRIAEFKNA